MQCRTDKIIQIIDNHKLEIVTLANLASLAVSRMPCIYSALLQPSSYVVRLILLAMVQGTFVVSLLLVGQQKKKQITKTFCR